MHQDDLAQVIVIADTPSDVWAQEHLDLSRGSRDQFLMLRDEHMKAQKDLRSSIREAVMHLGALRIIEDPSQKRRGIFRVTLPQRVISPMDVSDMIAMIRVIE